MVQLTKVEKNQQIVSSIYKIYHGEKLSFEDEGLLDEFINNYNWVPNVNKSVVFPTPEELIKKKKEQNSKIKKKGFVDNIMRVIKLPKWWLELCMRP